MGMFLKFLTEAKTAKKGSKVKILSGDGKGKSGEVVVAAGDDHFIVQVDGMDEKLSKKHDEIEVITESILTEAKTAKKGSKVKITSGDGKGKTGKVVVAAGDDHFIIEIEGMDEKLSKKHDEIEVITESAGLQSGDMDLKMYKCKFCGNKQLRMKLDTPTCPKCGKKEAMQLNESAVAVASQHFDDPINEGEIAKIQALAGTVQLPAGCTIGGWQYDWVGQRLGFSFVCEGQDTLENRFRVEDFINQFSAALTDKLDYKFIIQGGHLSSESWVSHDYSQYYIRKLTTTANAKETIIEAKPISEEQIAFNNHMNKQLNEASDQMTPAQRQAEKKMMEANSHFFINPVTGGKNGAIQYYVSTTKHGAVGYVEITTDGKIQPTSGSSGIKVNPNGEIV
jgi:hypothetical protein